MIEEVDGSFAVTVDLTEHGDISLTLTRLDLRIALDPAEAERVCRDVWAALGRELPAADSQAA